MNIESIKLIAALFSITGSIILAYRVTGILSALSLVARIQEANIQQLMPNCRSDMYNLINAQLLIEEAQKIRLLVIGFICMILSGLLQFIVLLIKNI